MNPPTFEKKSFGEHTLVFNLSPALAQGNSVASLAATVYDSASVDVTSTMLPDGITVFGNKATGMIKGGTTGNRYYLQLRGTLTNGPDKIEDNLIIVVQDFSL